MDPQVIFLGGMLLLLLLMFQRGSRQRRELANLQSRLAPGARIMTTAGLYATVRAVDGDVVTLETAPGQVSEWDRRAVARILDDASGQQPDQPEATAPKADEPEPSASAPQGDSPEQGSNPADGTDAEAGDTPHDNPPNPTETKPPAA